MTWTVLDLFSGAGGLSTGFLAAGFLLRGGLELNPAAAATLVHNLHPLHPERGQNGDITRLTPADLAARLHLGTVSGAVDVIIGGPPCQAYARLGRSKLRQIAAHPDAFLHDHRANLFEAYLAYVSAFRPRALLMENVPDILNQRGVNVAETIAEALEASGYTVAYTLLNASFYGVPQMRERMFLMAYRSDLGLKVEFPAPSHWTPLPSGYQSLRQVALHSLKGRGGDLFADLPGGRHRYVPAPAGGRHLTPAVTVADALGDLPPLRPNRSGTESVGEARRAQRLGGPAQPYRADTEPSVYARVMRDWPGLAPVDGVLDHVTRRSPRDHPLFARMRPGDQYPQAVAHAERLFAERLKERSARGDALTPDSDEWNALRAATVPPYDPTTFENRWRKMEPDRPARTLTAHLGHDTNTHIHPDSAQARTISVREAARLQSFPDAFAFQGSMSAAFRQIGNAVPPLLALAVARRMRETLERGAGTN